MGPDARGPKGEPCFIKGRLASFAFDGIANAGEQRHAALKWLAATGTGRASRDVNSPGEEVEDSIACCTIEFIDRHGRPQYVPGTFNRPLLSGQ